MNDKEFDYSIAFMKAFLSFCVILCHYWSTSHGGYPISALYRIKTVAVLIFFIISFHLTKNMFAEGNIGKFKKRVWRLIFPYICWAIIYYIVYKFIDWILKCFVWNDGLQIELSYRDLLWQVALGSDRNLCPPLWYQFDLILLTILIWIVFAYTKKYAWNVIIILMITAYAFQYSGLNYMLFGPFEYEMRYPLGRFVEAIPLACMGLLVANLFNLKKLREQRLFVLFICLSSMILISYLELFTTPENSFYYAGTYKAIYATLAFLFFYVIPFEKAPLFIKKSLMYLSKYSLGVFCMHFGVGFLWNRILCRTFGIRENTFVECIAIYIICILLSWSISKCPLKNVRLLIQ
ncbi:MAG: acyltransferase [Lachnospiraceae bacterium]|nr:acyltransferase [Lachnospiraceae bacterium]